MPRTIIVSTITLAIISAAVAFRADETPKLTPAPMPKEPIAGTRQGQAPMYYKGNLHTHSLWSDGDDYPEMIADWYKTHNYSFLMLSDHNIIADGEKWIPSESTAARKLATEKYAKRFGENWLERRDEKGVKQVKLKPLREFRPMLEDIGKFMLIPGEEVTHAHNKRPIHINAVNLRDAILPVDGKTAEESIQINMRNIAAAQSKAKWIGLSFLNHPNFRWGVKCEDFMGVEEVKFFEVFNGHPGVDNYGDKTHAGTERMWDILLAHRLGKLQLPVVYGVATDDSHAYHEFGAKKTNPGRGWVMVRAPYLTPEAIVRGMHAGDFYSSSGVVLTDVQKKDGELKIAIKAEQGVTYKTEFVATMKGVSYDSEPYKDDKGMELPVTRKYSDEIGKVVSTSTDANPSYKFTGKELYVRAKIISSKPHPNPYAPGDTEVAWTQPFTP